MRVDDDAAEGRARGEPQRQAGVRPREPLGQQVSGHESLREREVGDECGRHRRAREKVVRPSSGTVPTNGAGTSTRPSTADSTITWRASGSPQCREPKTMPPSIDANAHRPRMTPEAARGVRLLGERDDRDLVAAEDAADAHRPDDHEQEAGLPERAASGSRGGAVARAARRPGLRRPLEGERDRADQPDHRARDERQGQAQLEGQERGEQRADREDQLVDDALEGEGAAEAVRVRSDSRPARTDHGADSGLRSSGHRDDDAPGRRPGGRTRRRRRRRPGRWS